MTPTKKLPTLASLTQSVYLNKYKTSCNCGGPQYNTEHSPDCALILAWDHAHDEAEVVLAELIESNSSSCQ